MPNQGFNGEWILNSYCFSHPRLPQKGEHSHGDEYKTVVTVLDLGSKRRFDADMMSFVAVYDLAERSDQPFSRERERERSSLKMEENRRHANRC